MPLKALKIIESEIDRAQRMAVTHLEERHLERLKRRLLRRIEQECLDQPEPNNPNYGDRGSTALG